MDNVGTEEKSSTGQVTKEVQRQSNVAGELHELVDKLEIRLADVVTPLPKLEPSPCEERVIVAILAGQIQANNDLVEKCALALSSLLSRIEL